MTTYTRRTLLTWLGGALAGLVAAPAVAKPRPKTGRYSDVYSDRYGG